MNNYVDMRLSNFDMQDKYFNTLFIYVNMRDKAVDSQYS